MHANKRHAINNRRKMRCWRSSSPGLVIKPPGPRGEGSLATGPGLVLSSEAVPAFDQALSPPRLPSENDQQPQSPYRTVAPLCPSINKYTLRLLETPRCFQTNWVGWLF